MKLTVESLPMYCHEVGDCLHWAQGTNSCGYPMANVDGGVWMVRRYVFTRLLGHELQPRQPLTTRCGNKLCVTPGCLYATTMGAVLRKAYRNGSRSTQHEYLARLVRAQNSGMAKVTADQVRQLRDLGDDVSHADAGRMFGIHPKTASHIRRGLTWREAAPASSVFSWRPA